MHNYRLIVALLIFWSLFLQLKKYRYHCPRSCLKGKESETLCVYVRLLCAVVYIHKAVVAVACWFAYYLYYVVLLFPCSGIAEHHLTGKELLALKNILQEDVIDTLEQNLAKSGSVTTEEVRGLLHSLDQHEIASNLHFGKLVNAVPISTILYIILMVHIK